MSLTPYYSDSLVTIYHGDCLSVLRSGVTDTAGVAAVVTDVPYASGTRKEAGRSSSGAMLRGERWAEKPIENDQMTTPGFVWFVREICYAVLPLLIDGGSFLTFIDWRQWPNLLGAVESTNLRVNGMIVWDKDSYGLGNGFRQQHELVLHASKGTPRVCNHGVPNVLRSPRVPNDLHPSPKPQKVMRDILRVVSDEGDLVLDPMMGSGATIQAARDLNRRVIGIEIEERYCEITAERCRQGALDLGGAA